MRERQQGGPVVEAGVKRCRERERGRGGRGGGGGGSFCEGHSKDISLEPYGGGEGFIRLCLSVCSV